VHTDFHDTASRSCHVAGSFFLLMQFIIVSFIPEAEGELLLLFVLLLLLIFILRLVLNSQGT
jgi:hypothetical protein